MTKRWETTSPALLPAGKPAQVCLIIAAPDPYRHTDRGAASIPPPPRERIWVTGEGLGGYETLGGGAASPDGGLGEGEGAGDLPLAARRGETRAGGRWGLPGTGREGGEKGKGMGKGRAAAPRPRRTHPEDEGVDDEEGFQTRYHGFGLHSPRCHNTELPAAGWAREEEKGGGGGEGGRRRRQREVSSALGSPRRAAARRNALPAPATPPGGERPHGPGDGPQAENVSRRHCPRRGGEIRAEPEGAGLPQLSP